MERSGPIKEEQKMPQQAGGSPLPVGGPQPAAAEPSSWHEQEKEEEENEAAPLTLTPTPTTPDDALLVSLSSDQLKWSVRSLRLQPPGRWAKNSEMQEILRRALSEEQQRGGAAIGSVAVVLRAAATLGSRKRPRDKTQQGQPALPARATTARQIALFGSSLGDGGSEAAAPQRGGSRPCELKRRAGPRKRMARRPQVPPPRLPTTAAASGAPWLESVAAAVAEAAAAAAASPGPSTPAAILPASFVRSPAAAAAAATVAPPFPAAATAALPTTTATPRSGFAWAAGGPLPWPPRQWPPRPSAAAAGAPDAARSADALASMLSARLALLERSPTGGGEAAAAAAAAAAETGGERGARAARLRVELPPPPPAGGGGADEIATAPSVEGGGADDDEAALALLLGGRAASGVSSLTLWSPRAPPPPSLFGG